MNIAERFRRAKIMTKEKLLAFISVCRRLLTRCYNNIVEIILFAMHGNATRDPETPATTQDVTESVHDTGEERVLSTVPIMRRHSSPDLRSCAEPSEAPPQSAPTEPCLPSKTTWETVTEYVSGGWTYVASYWRGTPKPAEDHKEIERSNSITSFASGSDYQDVPETPSERSESKEHAAAQSPTSELKQPKAVGADGGASVGK
jgi:hypothetical protein